MAYRCSSDERSGPWASISKYDNKRSYAEQMFLYKGKTNSVRHSLDVISHLGYLPRQTIHSIEFPSHYLQNMYLLMSIDILVNITPVFHNAGVANVAYFLAETSTNQKPLLQSSFFSIIIQLAYVSKRLSCHIPRAAHL